MPPAERSRASRTRGLLHRPSHRPHVDSPERFMEPRTLAAPSEADSVIDCAIYVDGRRMHSPQTPSETFGCLQTEERGMAWIGLYRPREEELLALAEQFALHE